VGGAAGTAINLVFPDVPLALAVGCTMAALTGAALPAPFMIAIVVLLVTGIPATEGIPVLLAAFVAHGITFGFGLIPHSSAGQKQPSSATGGASPGTDTQLRSDG
jgi:hypothetical protein